MGGAGSVTIAANKGIKMDIARKVEAADHYIELERDRDAAKQQWAKLKEENPCMFLFGCLEIPAGLLKACPITDNGDR